MNQSFGFLKKTAALLAALMLFLTFSACGRDNPPSTERPLPAELEGDYVGEYGVLTFKGDGRSISIDVSEELAALTGFPEGESKGSYVFLFHNESYRCDLAEYFRVLIGSEEYLFRNDRTQTNENTVAFFVEDYGEEPLVFKKQP